MGEEAFNRSKKKKPFKVPAILIIVWTMIIVLFGYSLWAEKSNEVNDNILEVSTDTDQAKDDAGENVVQIPLMTDEQMGQAKIRDSKRLADMKMLRSTLETYKNDNDHYPELFENLVPDYLEFLPQNPSPGGQPYVYTGIGSKPFSYYDISYSLEVGVEGLDPGVHITSPGGIATP